MRNSMSVFLRVVVLACCLAGHALAQTLATAGTPPFVGERGYMFDIEASKNLIVDSLDVKFNLPASVEVWTTLDGGSYVGQEENPQAWRRVASVELDLVFGNVAFTPLSLDMDVLILSGTKRGFYCCTSEFEPLLGLGNQTLGSIVASNSDMTLRVGIANETFRKRNPEMMCVQVHYSVHGPYLNDLRLTNVLSPSPSPHLCDIGATAETVTVEFLNLGTSALFPGTVIPVDIIVDDQPAISDFVVTSTSVPPNTNFSHTLGPTVDLSEVGQHTIMISQSWAQDLDPTNNFISVSTPSGGVDRVASFPWRESFDSLHPGNQVVPPLGWTQEATDAAGPLAEWQFARQRVTGTRPDADHTTGVSGEGYFAHTNDLGNHANVSLRSPCLDLTAVSNPRLVFWLSSVQNGVPANSISVDVIDAFSGVVTSSVFNHLGNLPAGWHRQLVDLSAFSGTVIRLVFRADTSNSGFNPISSGHEFGVDDVAVFDMQPALGQAAQPGFASFKIGDPVNQNLDTVDSGANGPFFETVEANELMLFEFSGEPHQSVMLIGGARNPQVATFPLIGSLDIGGQIDPLSGIPLGIVVLANGDLPNGSNPLFTTGASGDGLFGITVPNVAPGLLTTFQCVIRTSGANGSYIALSNAIEISID